MNSLLARTLALIVLGAATACGAARYYLDPAQMHEFLLAGPVVPELDREALMRAIPVTGPYRVGTGDVLEIRGQRALFARVADQVTGNDDLHQARVDADGNIQVPLAGSLQVRGRTLLEVEAAVTAAIYPKYLVNKPSIVARVVEHQTVPLTVIGAVEKPGVHELRSDQMTLYNALSVAGGILKATNLVVGARLIRVRRAGGDTASIALPVKGLNVPFADVPLRGGDVVEVERYEPDTFTVVGLVNKPGAYEYPPEVDYNLMQALAIAGGVDLIADPPYATVFRKDKNGQILPATFGISGSGLVESSGLKIKPGDVIVIEHTPASWTRSLLDRILRIQMNFFWDPSGK